MKGIVLYNGYSDMPQYRHQISRFVEEFEFAGVCVDAIPNDMFGFCIKEGKSATDFDFDFCLYLDKDDYVSSLIEKMGKPIFNRSRSIIECDDKMLTYISLIDKGIRMPDTTPGPLFYDPNMSVRPDCFDILEKRYGYPVIVKESFGSSGRGVYIAYDRGELESILTELRGRKYIVQKYIDSSKGEDLRVIVIGGKVIGGMIRHSDNDFRSNAALGAVSYPADVPEISRKISENVAEILGLDYCGIDLLKDESGAYSIVCEVNSNAFFMSFEKTTGINVAKAYVEHILKSLQSIDTSKELLMDIP